MKELGKRPLTFNEVKRALEKQKKDVEELPYEQKAVLEYVRKFALNKKETEAKIKQLKEIGVENEKILVKLINIRPDNPDVVKLIFSHQNEEVDDETAEKIVALFG